VRKGVLVLALVSGIALGVVGCPFSTSVPEADIIGEHVADYDFGTDTLVILKGGEFRQTLKVGKESVVQRGRWSIDREGKLMLHGWIDVADEFGDLNVGWHKMVRSEVALPVERIWFRVVVGSGATVPYRKVLKRTGFLREPVT
jgi:hypothetical protein